MSIKDLPVLNIFNILSPESRLMSSFLWVGAALMAEGPEREKKHE